MKVLFDTNVVLDVLLARDPHVHDASKLFALVDRGLLVGSICATTATTVHYLAAKSVGAARARVLVQELLELFQVAPVDGAVLERALHLAFSDFEDAVLHEAASASGVSAIVTRNGGDFVEATLPVFAPNELLAAIAAGS